MKNTQSKFRFYFEFILLPVFLILLFLPFILGIYISKEIKITNGTVESVSVNLLRRGITVSGLTLNNFPVDSVTQVSGNINRIIIAGIDVMLLYRKKELEVDALIIHNPQMSVEYSDAGRDSNKKQFKISRIGRVRVRSGDLIYKNREGDSLSIENVSLEYSPFIEKETIATPDKYKFRSGTFRFQPADKLHSIAIKKIDCQSRTGELTLDSVMVMPGFSERDFKNHIPFQSDRFDFECPQIIVQIHPFSDQVDSIISIQSVSLPTLRLHAFRDKHIPRDPEKKYEMLQYYLKNAPYRISIDSLMIEKGNFMYRELSEKNEESGEIHFTNAKITARDIQTGNPTKESLNISFQTGFMKSGKLRAKVEFPYNKMQFHCKGQVSDMPFAEINPMSGPNGGVLFADGHINSMPFEFTAFNSHSEGVLSVNYRNLDFSVKDKPTGDTTNFISKAITLAASWFIKKEGKKKDEDIILQGRICQERSRDRFIFNYMWKSILSGFRAAMTESFGEKEESKKPC